MSTGPETDPTPIGEAIKRDFGSVMNLNREIFRITEDRDRILQSIRDRIRNGDVPDDQKYVAAELLGSSMQKLPPAEIQARIDFWAELDANLIAHAGETIAWLEPEEVTESHRFIGPDDTRFDYYLNLGILPADARLQIPNPGNVGSIPLEKAARVRFFYNLDEEVEWNMGIGNVFHFVEEPEIFTDQQSFLLVAPGRLIPDKAWGFPNTVSLPLPVIGNDAVAAILEANNLADLPEVQRTAQMLTESLAS